MSKLETKTLGVSALELKMADDGGMKFSGYASVFDGVDSYGDTIIKGAYVNTLQNRQRPVRMLYNHMGTVIGKWLKMYEDEKGLYVEGELTPGHSKAADVYASMKHGTLGGMSIGYYVRAYEQLGDDRRMLKEIELVEVSVVDEPADLAAKITDVKGAISGCMSLKEIEFLLRDAGGFSRADACALVARVKALHQSDSDAESKAVDELDKLFARFKA